MLNYAYHKNSSMAGERKETRVTISGPHGIGDSRQECDTALPYCCDQGNHHQRNIIFYSARHKKNRGNVRESACLHDMLAASAAAGNHDRWSDRAARTARERLLLVAQAKRQAT